MKRWIAMVGWAALVAGCNQHSVRETKQDAQLHWQETRARVAYGVAMEQFKAGQLDLAFAKAQECLGLVPQDLEARLLLGRIYIEKGQYALAQAELKKVCDGSPMSYEPVYLLGVAQERSGRLDDALASYRKAQGLDSSNAQAVTAAAEVMVAMGNVVEAQAYVEGYLGLAGDEPGMYELAGRLAMMQEDYPQAAKYYATAADLAPANIPYRESLAEALFSCQRYSEAAETLRALTRLPKYSPPAWAWAMLGDCSLAANQPQDARQSYLAARDLEPDNARHWTNLAKAALALGDAARAIVSAQEALRRDASGPEAVLILGYALLKEGQADKAVGVLAGAVEKFPDQIVLRCLLGRAYAAKGDAAQAVDCYQAALKMQPDNPLAKDLLAAASRPLSPAE